jgi:hypothetical protein
LRFRSLLNLSGIALPLENALCADCSNGVDRGSGLGKVLQGAIFAFIMRPSWKTLLSDEQSDAAGVMTRGVFAFEGVEIHAATAFCWPARSRFAA